MYSATNILCTMQSDLIGCNKATLVRSRDLGFKCQYAGWLLKVTSRLINFLRSLETQV